MFCLNYNCSIITLGGQSDHLRKLEKQTGMLLRGQQDMENKMIDFFKEKVSAVDENNRIFDFPVRKKTFQGIRP